MTPNLYAIAAADATIQSLLGVEPRFYPVALAPQDPVPPYATYQLINANPENALTCAPDIDQANLVLDFYSYDHDELTSIFSAFRSVFEVHGHVVRIGSDARDFETQLYHCDFDLDMFVSR